jgi:protein O-mannosyl-transferase
VNSHPGFARMAGLVALVALALHAPSVAYDFTYLDDDQLILGRAAFLSDAASFFRAFAEPYFGPGSSSYYRPLVTASYVFDAQWSGVRALGYHVTNVALHGAISVLLLWLLLALGLGRLPALIAALLFAVHPLQTASVAWIVGRNDLLLTGFVLGSSACLLLEAQSPRALTKLGHVACFLGALFSKETALPAPVWFVAFAWAAGDFGVVRRRWLWAAWGLGFGLYFAARAVALDGSSAVLLDVVSLESARVLLADLGKLLVPVRLQVLSAPVDVAAWPGLIAALVLLAVGVGVRGLRAPVLVLAGSLMSLPALAGLYGAKHVVLENRLYLAVAGVAVLGGEVLRALGAGERPRPASRVAPAALLLALAVATARYSRSFASADDFSRAAIAASPHSGVAVNLLQRAAMRNSGAGSNR